MLIAKIPAPVIRYFVLRYRETFLNSFEEHSDEDFFALGEENGYNLDTLEFVTQRIRPKSPAAPLIVPDSEATRKLYEIACSNLGSIKTAQTFLSPEQFQDVLLYDPARWCHDFEAVNLVVVHLTDQEKLFHLLDCLPRRQNAKITKETIMLVCQTTHQILIKLLEKFPSSSLSFEDFEQYRKVHDAMGSEERLIIYQHGFVAEMFWCSTPLEILTNLHWAGEASAFLTLLISRQAHALMIKLFCILKDLSLLPEQYENFAKLTRRHSEKDDILDFLRSITTSQH
jgi:hypothetical protein